MKPRLGVALMAVGLVLACAESDRMTPDAPPTPTALSLGSPSMAPDGSPLRADPIGALPDDCRPGPDPVAVSDHVGPGLGGDPVWAIGFGPAATLTVNPDDPHEDHGWLRKVLWLLRRTHTDPVSVTGSRVDDAAPLWFDYGDQRIGTATLVLDPAAPHGEQGDWFEYRGYFVIPEAGCYRLSAAWHGGGWELDFRAGLEPTLGRSGWTLTIA